MIMDGRTGIVMSRSLGLVSLVLTVAASATVWSAGAAASDEGTAVSHRRGTAPAGSNLLGNSGAQIGAASVQGWDTVTIPGWAILRGLPTVVRYGTRGFPPASGPFPAARDGQLFSGGVGGTAVLRQSVGLMSPGGGPLAPGVRFTLSAWLGGTESSNARVTVRFFSIDGRPVGSARVGPAGATPGRHRTLVRRVTSGRLPNGTLLAQVYLTLATTLRGADGPNGPAVGYNRAIADNIRLSVSTAVRRPAPVAPPAARLPRYKHVFLFYFENQDFRSLIGNASQAPYFNSLLPKFSLLANLYAEEHPSDANYMALAGGSAFGIPLTDPLEINPLFTIRARNISDLLTAAHESWKGYLQSANGPCDDTVHGQYWNDDLPLLYFADIRDRPRYCSSHVVPLEELSTDLARASTTPNFAWIGPDDCSDMEGCGIRAGDQFLARELGAILRSPAWRTQRSLAIITVDEDNYDDPHPPQRVATIMLGSSGVRAGYVSRVRYTHYSLLRTIEAALGLSTLTANDRYAQPVNDVFATHEIATHKLDLPSAGSAVAAPAADSSLPTRRLVRAVPSLVRRRADLIVFVANSASGTVTPIDLRTRRAGNPIRVGADPEAVAASPNGRTVYVANAGSGTVTPIDTAALRAGRPIRVGADPRALAITPNGETVYVANSGSGTVTPISARTGRAGRPVRVGRLPRAVVIAPSGKYALVLDWGGGQVTAINTADNRAGRPVAVGGYPVAASFDPDGTAYVACFGSDAVTPVAVAAGRAGRPIRVGMAPDAVAVSRDGRTVYVVNGDSQSVSVISARTGRVRQTIDVGYSPSAVALSGSGTTAYVVNTISGTVTPIMTATGRKARPLSVGTYSYPVEMAVDPAGTLGVVIDTYAGQVSLIATRTGRVSAPITVGGFPSAVAFAR
jgi:YVTN family beta-propeller protein